MSAEGKVSMGGQSGPFQTFYGWKGVTVDFKLKITALIVRLSMGGQNVRISKEDFYFTKKQTSKQRDN